MFRTGQYSGGEWVYTNGLRQARGANSDLLERSDYFAAVKPSPVDPTSISFDLYNAFTYDFFGSHRAAHNGDYQLPDSLPAGTGEVAEVRLAIEGGDLFVRFLWNSFPAPDAQIATLTFGDGPVAAWPRNAKQSGCLRRRPDGLGHRRLAGPRQHRRHPSPTRTGNHTSEARIPLSLLPAGPWTLRGGSGLTDPADRTRYWTVPRRLRVGNVTRQRWAALAHQRLGPAVRRRQPVVVRRAGPVAPAVRRRRRRRRRPST